MKLPKYIISADIGEKEDFSVFIVFELQPIKTAIAIDCIMQETRTLNLRDFTVSDRKDIFEKNKRELMDKYNIKE